ncbi:MAG: hypothetical protein RI964_835 [Pseudomonadota bacterium]|jgi:hypothetical protein
MSHKAFFDVVRHKFYPDGLTQQQVDNINLIIDAFAPFDNPYWTAYALATAYHETAATFESIEEHGKGRGRAYGKPENGKVYYGRGFVQLTWLDNYATFARRLSIDLIKQPELALQADIAVQIMVLGMTKGLFTGVGLDDFSHTDGTLDYLHARKVINGMDKAALIAGYAEQFYAALTAPDATPEPQPTVVLPVNTPALTAPEPQPAATLLPNPLVTAFTSKIVWVQLVGLASTITSFYGVELTAEQQATLVKLTLIIMTIATTILRTFFNQGKNHQ